MTGTAAEAEEGGGAVRDDEDDGAPSVGERNGGADEVDGNAVKPMEVTPSGEEVRSDGGGEPELVGDGGERGKRRERVSDGCILESIWDVTTTTEPQTKSYPLDMWKYGSALQQRPEDRVVLGRDRFDYGSGTFASIRTFRMKLSPEKCTFGLPSGKLLGFMVSHRGIQANPEKINVILNMKPPSSWKDVQKLTGCMAALSRKLSHYFQGHSDTVDTSFPLGDILHNREANGRIAKWALELMSLDLSFKLRTSIKSQALVDFVAKWTECQEDTPAEKTEYWTMHFDGSKRLSGIGAGVVLISPTRERLSYVLWIHFSASHNVAEYEALLHGLRITISLGIRRLIVHGNSQLVVNHVMKEWSCLDDNMTAYLQEVRKLEDKFDGLELPHVLQHNNEAADRLANFGSKREAAPSDVFVEHLYEPTVPRKEIIEATDTQETHLPAQELQTIPLSWPFVVCGLDMAGPFKKVVGGYTHLFVAVDKFSKWIEAKPVITITADMARDFFINIVHRFGVPNRIITDNGTQFIGGVFKDFCEDFGIKIC
uniref:Retrotransposon protein, putative, Ty3-gypsy subclass n=1 Tax=Oryza sativa subsp. japonica TaxID=39947 RepID=Q2QSN1_ORYSJ|nr:retrotransposon protein, putative, Ty3-gypsy subclass [Oryza sativa Japonica Group]